MGELKVGTELIGANGEIQEVTKIWPRGEQKAYRVSFSDGSSTVCGDDHLWTLHQKDRKPKTKPLHKFADDLMKRNGKHDHAKWRLPSQPMLTGSYKLPIPLHPYLLGVMLGDGSMTWRSARFYNENPTIIHEIEEVLPTDHVIRYRSGIGYDIVMKEGRENKIIRALKEIGAWGHLAPAKFVPERCLLMSWEDRLALLQGLLDTDGSVSGTSVRFGSSSEDLANGVIELVRSLGGYATLHRALRTKPTWIEGRKLEAQGEFYEVCISGLNARTLFRSSKKYNADEYARYEARHRRLVSVEEIEPTEMQCITVSNADGLYITDDFIITHNCIDEMAHMIPGESKAAADQVYNAADPSLDQFGVDGMMFCNSSPYSKVGMFFDRHEAALVEFDPDRPLDDVVAVGEEGDIDIHDLNGDPRIFTLGFASWSLFEGYQKSKKAKQLKWTLMACPEWDENQKNEDGTPYWNDKDITAIKAARAKEKQNPETYKVERRGKFAEVSEAYIIGSKVDQMYAGIPIEWVSEMDPRTRQQGPLLPVFAELMTNDMGRVGEYGRHKFHIDPSSTTAGFGFAIAHPETIFNGATDVEEEHVVFDLIKRWQPQHFPGKVIRWETVLPELLGYAELFRPFEITFGQHESLQAMQELDEKLRAKNYSTRIFQSKETAELNWKRWEVTKTSIYSNLVHAPKDNEDNVFSSLELKFLQKKSGAGRWPRIDKQEMGPVTTKDMADCIAECVSTLIGNQIANRTRDRLTHSALLGGSPGGYQIGLGANPAVGGGGPPGISEYYSRRDEKIGSGGNPARGVLGGGRSRRNRNRARW
jgi:hypothetical protein